MPDARYRIQDAGQIMDDLVPICRPEGGVFIGNAIYWIVSSRRDLSVVWAKDWTGSRPQECHPVPERDPMDKDLLAEARCRIRILAFVTRRTRRKREDHEE